MALEAGALPRRVPREIVDRPKKGFSIPLSEWLRGPLKTWADELLDPAVLGRDGYLHPGAVTTTWRGHKSGLLTKARASGAS